MALQDVLGKISGGRVLDVATGRGGMVRELIEGLADYTEIIGVDSNPAHAELFSSTFTSNAKIHFQCMDASNLEFPDDYFNTVCVSNSLHHFADPLMILQEMLRVLRPGGKMIVSEMVRDGQNETQLTHVYLHDWWAQVDRTNGIIHNETYTFGELTTIVSGLGLTDLSLYDEYDRQADPHDPELITELDGIIESYQLKAQGQPELVDRGGQLRKRVHQVGFHNATRVVMIGMKRFG